MGQKKYLVEITDAALADMDGIYRYIAEVLKSRINAAGQYDRIADEIESLDRTPERYPVCDFLPEDLRELHRLSVDNYSVFYLIRDNRVIVTDVLYSASNLERRLMDRHQDL